MIRLNFQPKQTTKVIIAFLDKKPRNVIEQRFGLTGAMPKTLEAIGQGYGITRERVRQIEEDAMRRLRKSEGFSKLRDAFSELKEKINLLGGIVHEKEFLNHLSTEVLIKQCIRFLLVLGEEFEHMKENEEFHHRWTIDSNRAEKIHNALARLHKDLSSEELLSDKEIYSRFADYGGDAVSLNSDKEVIGWLLKISRLIDSNPLGEWGHIASPSIRPRGVRDLAFLTMRKHGSPMHFAETAQAIGGIFGKTVNTQTVHNELIKDARFVLVGRGLYALKEWGYESGIVRDVIRKVLSAMGPMPKDDIIKTVMKERYVKENTIMINLQNGKYFKKNPDDTYMAIN